MQRYVQCHHCKNLWTNKGQNEYAQLLAKRVSEEKAKKSELRSKSFRTCPEHVLTSGRTESFIQKSLIVLREAGCISNGGEEGILEFIQSFQSKAKTPPCDMQTATPSESKPSKLWIRICREVYTEVHRSQRWSFHCISSPSYQRAFWTCRNSQAITSSLHDHAIVTYPY